MIRLGQLPGALLAAGRARLALRPDSEHQMAFNRAALAAGMILYLHLVMAEPGGTPLTIGYLAMALLVVALMFVDQRVDHIRRVAILALDMISVSWILHVDGQYGAACYPIYLWVIFGNGFRLGLRYLYIADALAIACFSLVWAFTPFWRDLPALSGSLLFALISLPLYAATLIRKLSNARRDAEAANRAKSYFLASVSHELRTPLTAVIGLSEQIADLGEGEDDREMARTIVTAGRGLLSLINQLLDFSRLEAGGVAIRHEPFALLPLLAEVRALMRHPADEKGLALSLHVRPGTPLKMMGDEARLRDILINLLGNALKFTTEGAITIVADSYGAGGTTYLRLAVQDTGIGIAPEAQEKIFGSFVQADESIIDRFGGTGLGLAICKQLAERLGGRIWVQSAVGQGARFSFTAAVTPLPADQDLPECVLLIGAAASQLDRFRALLPARVTVETAAASAALDEAILSAGGARVALVADAADGWAPLDSALMKAVSPLMLCPPDQLAAPTTERAVLSAVALDADAQAICSALTIVAATPGRAEAAPASPAEEASKRPSRRILVADDNPMNRKVFAMILGRAGHEVEIVEHGEAALDRMRAESFDVVLMDVNMPVMNGIEATKLYRFAALGQPRVPIVAVTADVSDDNIARCREAGMDACLGKPIDADELITLIESLTTREPVAARAPLPFDPSATVVPLFGPQAQDAGMLDTTEEAQPALDPTALAELAELGGEEFVGELLAVYREDAAAMGARVRRAVEANDLTEFREGTHALRSSAANIGASRLAELCRHYQRIAEPEFHLRAAQHLLALEAELARVAAALARHDRGFAAAGTASG